MSREEDIFRKIETIDGQLEHRRMRAIEAQSSNEAWRNMDIWEYIQLLEKVVYKSYREGIFRSDEGLTSWRTAVRNNKLPYAQ
jgi:hypothetical protein